VVLEAGWRPVLEGRKRDALWLSRAGAENRIWGTRVTRQEASRISLQGQGLGGLRPVLEGQKREALIGDAGESTRTDTRGDLKNLNRTSRTLAAIGYSTNSRMTISYVCIITMRTIQTLQRVLRRGFRSRNLCIEVLMQWLRAPVESFSP
jgi:hypothetical protein